MVKVKDYLVKIYSYETNKTYVSAIIASNIREAGAIAGLALRKYVGHAPRGNGDDVRVEQILKNSSRSALLFCTTKDFQNTVDKIQDL